jgi:hypothetical protein
MRLRHDRKTVTDEEEEALERSVREREGPAMVPPPPAAFWSRQIVEVNRRIDESTSGVALSLSWAARVAIPGVVAVLSFLIGLKYYAPERHAAESLRQATSALASATVESLYVASVAASDTAVINDVNKSLLPFNNVQAEEFYVENAGTTTLVEDLSDQELHQVLAALSSVEK